LWGSIKKENNVKGGETMTNITDVLKNVDAIIEGLKEQGYYINKQVAIAIRNAYVLKKPLFVEGPPGVGKTQLAKSLHRWLDCKWFRLQCTPETNEKKALYQIDFQKQLLQIQLYKNDSEQEVHQVNDFFTREYLIERPILKAMQQDKPSILLIDELDKSEEAFDSHLLEALGEYSVSISELNETIFAKEIPLTIITSNNARPISDAILRRCVYVHIDYPTAQEETELIQTIVGSNEVIARGVATVMEQLRDGRKVHLKQKPSISEGLEWAQIISIHLSEDEKELKETMLENVNIIAKSEKDQKTITNKIESMAI